MLLGETGTPTHCAHVTGARSVHVASRAPRVGYAALPGAATADITHHLRRVFPGVHECRDVLEAALSGADPVVRPATILGELGLIAAADAERLAIGRALGYELLAESELRAAEGGGGSECCRDDAHGILHEGVGLGLVTYVSLGGMLGVPTPTCETLVARAAAVTGRDYLAEGRRTVERLGLAGLSAEAREGLLQTPRRM